MTILFKFVIRLILAERTPRPLTVGRDVVVDTLASSMVGTCVRVHREGQARGECPTDDVTTALYSWC